MFKLKNKYKILIGSVVAFAVLIVMIVFRTYILVYTISVSSTDIKYGHVATVDIGENYVKICLEENTYPVYRYIRELTLNGMNINRKLSSIKNKSFWGLKDKNFYVLCESNYSPISTVIDANAIDTRYESDGYYAYCPADVTGRSILIDYGNGSPKATISDEKLNLKISSGYDHIYILDGKTKRDGKDVWENRAVKD